MAELIKMDFANVEKTNIQYKNSKDGFLDNYTRIIVFIKESGEWESKEYYTNCEGWFDSNPEHILSAQIEELREIGIELHQIQKRGVIFNQIRVGFSIGEIGIYWYQIDESYDGKSNVVLFASVPRKISINVGEIIQAKQ